MSSLLCRHTLGFWLLMALLGSACKPSKPPEPTAASSSPAAAEPAPVVNIEGLKLGQGSEADVAWEEVEKLLEAPPAPEAWQTKEPTPEETAAFEKKLGVDAAAAAAKARAFYEKYPDHSKAGEAKEHEIDLLNVATQLGQTNLMARLEQLESAKLAQTNLAASDRLELRIKQIQRSVKLSDDSDITNSVSVMDRGVRTLQKEFPDRPEPLALLLSVAEGWIVAGQVEKARPILKELGAINEPEELKEAVRQLAERLDRIGKPVELAVTTLDGKRVDLKSLQGKVVMLQFWATWSASSVNQLAAIKAAYEQYHDKGFEIIGLSLDRERPALEQVLADQKIAWPQSFEGEASELPEKFKITTLPTLWLIDRQGNLRDINARNGLAARIGHLLAEKP